MPPAAALTRQDNPVTLRLSSPRRPHAGAPGNLPRVGKAVPAMAKALFGHVVAPAELRVAEENAALRARVRRLERELAELRAERDAAIAHELLSLTDKAEPALAR